MRIQAGLYKGRKLLSPPGTAETRPMTGSVKKSLFGMLQPWMDGAVVLDLYSGTGTMGLEALSRGAARCCFADKDRSVIERLNRNINDFGVDEQCTVWAGDIVARLAAWTGVLDQKVDVAFVDPPYAHARTWDWDEVAAKIFVPLAGCLASDGRVVLRTPEKVNVPEQLGGLTVVRAKDYGQMVVNVYGFKEEE